MADPFSNVNGLTDQGRKLSAVAKSDTVDLTDVPKALLCTAAGNIAITAVDGNFDNAGVITTTSLVIPVAAGAVFDAVRVRRVWSAGTTATVLAIA